MDFNMLGMKELYECVITSPNMPFTIGSKTFEPNEPIVIFDSLQLANIQELKTHIRATGGYHNTTWINWDDTKEVNVAFSQGIFSRIQLALLGNAAMKENQTESVPKVNYYELNENKQFELEHTPTLLFIYDLDGNKVDYELDGNIVTCSVLKAYQTVMAYYLFEYEDVTKIIVGQQLSKGFLAMTGKTRAKDDITGKTVTGLFTFPKIKLMSDFSMRLGNAVPPAIGNFYLTAFPVGSRGNERTMEFTLLNDDIDADI